MDHHNSVLRTLPDLSFSVVKVHHILKRKQDRILKLTSDGILNCKQTGKCQMVTKSFPYKNVKRVILKDTNNFIIQYHNDHDFFYRSPVSMQIVQEINNRMYEKKTTDKIRHSVHTALEYQRKLNLDSSDTLLEEAYLMQTVAEANEGLNLSNGVDAAIAAARVKQARKLKALTGTTEAQRLELAVDKLCLDTDSSTGSEVAKAIAEFNKSNNAAVPELPSTVRQFLTSMKNYVVGKKAAEFERLLIQANTESTTSQDISLAAIIEKCLQKAIILPKRDLIRKAICAASEQVADGTAANGIRQREENLRIKLQQVKGKSQDFFCIPKDFQSPNNWIAAINELKNLNDVETPHEKMRALLSSAKAIYVAHNYYKNRGAEKKTTYFMNADEFLPIHIYTIVHSDLVDPIYTSEYLWALSDPDSLQGEGGYYLTVFCSALSFLENINPETGKIDEGDGDD
eukprot:GEZU01017629.1.p1 GENE.GEZU01017629.1~~GEZU01017629.1.p1  ORF type:complete len:457 (-),score=85.18 GEZU01017629.1:53-1423(-)